MKDISSLKKKLAGYSAMTTAVLAVNHQGANAQIIYHDINPDVYMNVDNTTTQMDLDNDGVYDFKITFQVNGSNSSGRIDPLGNNEVMCTSSTDVDALSLSQQISPNPQFGDYWSFQQKPMFVWGWGPWVNATDKYAGILLHQADGNHFGWIRLTHGTQIQDFAYNSQPGSTILAGEMGYAVGVSGETNAGSFDAFVNDRHLIINFPQSTVPSQMTLLNSVGEKLNEQVITQSQLVMDVSAYASGIYFVVVNDGAKNQVKKVVIQ